MLRVLAVARTLGSEVAKRRMPRSPFAEGLQLVEELGERREPCLPRRIVNELDLESSRTLGDGVVLSVAPAAHAADDPVSQDP